MALPGSSPIMPSWLALSMALLLFADADVPRINSLRSPANPSSNFPPEGDIPLFPGVTSSSSDGQAGPQAPPKGSGAAANTALQDNSKLSLIRYVSGEFAKAVKPMPAGKEGFQINVGKPLNSELLDRAVANRGAAVNTGDQVQITRLEFRAHQIVVDINGGGRGRKRWRDHIQLSMGGAPMPSVQSTSSQDQGPPGMQPGMGSTIVLEFSNPVPDLSPDDLKNLLSPFLNFAKERSAALQWIDTLPPEMKKAIQERKPVLGMDREEVVAAIGKPDHKVRERDTDGNDIEDWIYGQPPSRTVFIRFTGDRVTGIKQFPQ